MNELPRLARILARLIPAGDRESILGDLIEDAGFRDLAGARRSLWLTGECAAIAGGLSIQRARSWVEVPPVREVAAGLALDGRGVFRSAGAAGSLLRAILFCGSVATLALGVEVLVSSLLSASGYSLSRPTAAAQRPRRSQRSQKPKFAFFVAFVALVIFVAAAVGRLNVS